MTAAAMRMPGRGLLWGQRMVVVDDNRPFRELLRHTLLAAGAAEVRGFGDAAEALKAIVAEPPAVVISDWRMEPMDGRAFLRALRGLEAVREIPVLVLSAYASGEVLRAAMGAGAAQVMVKPFVPQKLVERIVRLVEIAAPAPAGQAAPEGVGGGAGPAAPGADTASWEIE